MLLLIIQLQVHINLYNLRLTAILVADTIGKTLFRNRGVPVTDVTLLNIVGNVGSQSVVSLPILPGDAQPCRPKQTRWS